MTARRPASVDDASDAVIYRPFHGGSPGELALVVNYFVYGTRGVLLYIGQTNNLRRRLREHRRLAPWWPDALQVLYVGATSREVAVRSERNLIAELNPLHNIVGRSA